MSLSADWLAAIATAAALLLYEAWLLAAARRRPERSAAGAHGALREEWFAAVSEQKGSEILAVQTLRNALMSSSMLASTAALALMGSAALAAPALAWHPTQQHVSARAAMELALLALLFASLAASVMSARYFNHASFVGGMPVGSEARAKWAPLGAAYARTAGALYGWALRQLLLVAAPIAFILHPLVGPPAAAVVVGVLLSFDRFDPGAVAR